MANKINDFKQLIKDKGLEEQFLKMANLDSLDSLHPRNFEDASTSFVHKGQTVVSAEPIPAKELKKDVIDAPERHPPSVASDILAPFMGIHISYPPRKRLSSYAPSCLMMDYLVHIMNNLLVDNYYAKRHVPDYHPYILRLYYGFIFWIQCLRAGHEVRAIDCEQHQFLSRFLDAHPLDSLPVASPLLPLFQSLCSSQPEIPTYGKVYPRLPATPGPTARRDFIKNDIASFFLPNIPGIFALIEDLISVTSAETNPTFPPKGKHNTVTEGATQAKIFGHHSFPVHATRTDLQKWSLCSPGLQYACEADKKLNESFNERIDEFNFPVTRENDRTDMYEHYFSTIDSNAWFSQVKAVASGTAEFFHGSGTLADCPPSGYTANQIVVEWLPPATLPTPPAKVADKRSLFPFQFRLRSTARNPPQLSEAMACMAQTNAEMFESHPFLGTYGADTRMGSFWDIRPVEKSQRDDSSYLSLGDVVKKMMAHKL